jgi:hypothetical protein
LFVWTSNSKADGELSVEVNTTVVPSFLFNVIVSAATIFAKSETVIVQVAKELFKSFPLAPTSVKEPPVNS